MNLLIVLIVQTVYAQMFHLLLLLPVALLQVHLQVAVHLQVLQAAHHLQVVRLLQVALVYLMEEL